MKIKPPALIALVCVALVVTGESFVVFNQVERVTANWRSQERAWGARVDAAQITTGLMHALVRATK